MKAKLKKRNSKITLVLFAFLFAAIGGYFIINSFAAVPITRYVNPNGLDTNSQCTSSSAPCKTFNRAYQVSSGGDTVIVQTGDYGTQTFTGRSDLTSAVKFVADKDANGNAVNITNSFLMQDQNTPVSYITFDGRNADGSYGNHWDRVSGNIQYGAHHINFYGIHIRADNTGTTVYTTGRSHDIGFYDGELGPQVKGSDVLDFQPRNPGDPVPYNITVKGNDCHGVTRLDASSHPDCIQFYTSCVPASDCVANHPEQTITGVLIEGNTFYNNEDDNMQCDQSVINPMVRNNVFYNAVISGFHGVRCMGENVTYAYNTFPDGALIQMSFPTPPNTPFDTVGLTFVGNIGSQGQDGGCLSGSTYSHNIWYGQQCPGDNQKATNLAAIKINSSDGSLMANSPAINAGDPSNYPIDDILGNPRRANNQFVGSGPDAGAYEFGSSAQSGQTANIWVDTNGGSCQRSDPGTYANLDAKSCSSPQAAYNVASPNDLVLIQQGNYTASFSGGTKSPSVTLKSADGSTSVGNPTKPSMRAAVKIGAISLGNNTGHFILDGVEFNGLTMPGNDAGPSQSWSNFTILNSTQTADTLMRFSACTQDNANVLLDNNYHPGITGPDFPDGRISFFGPYDGFGGNDFCGVKIQNSYFSGGFKDGIYIVGPQGIKIINNTFVNMGPGAYQGTGDGPHTDGVQCVGGCQLTLDHNYFGHSGLGQMQGFGCFDGCDREQITNNVFDLGAGASFETLTLASDYDSFVDHNTLATGVTCVYTVPCGQIQLGHKPPAPDCDATCSDPSEKTTITNNIAAGISVRTNDRTGDTAGLIDYNLVTGGVSGIPADNIGTHNIDGSATYVGPPSGKSTTAFNSFSAYALAAGSLGKNTGSSNKDIGADFSGTTTPPPPTCTKQPDINCDNAVNVTDLSILLSNYGKTTAQLASSTPSYPKADINTSGKVDIADLSALLTGYGK